MPEPFRMYINQADTSFNELYAVNFVAMISDKYSKSNYHLDKTELMRRRKA